MNNLPAEGLLAGMKTADAIGWDSLEAVWQTAWALLARGVADAKDPMRTGVFVTGGLFPNPRSVVLRKAEPSSALLTCYSDLRAQKVAEIEASPRVAWHFWHPRRQAQLRLYGTASLHQGDALAEEAWARLSAGSRRNYQAQLPPFSPVASWEEGAEAYPQPAPPDEGRSHFVLIRTRVEALEALLLHPGGHRKAYFDCRSLPPQGQWRVP
jgi:hypothetical protein